MAIPVEVKAIIETIKRNGYDAYIVGGAVRNTIMNRPVNDWDITTSARPEVIESMFEKTSNVGKNFGTIIVHLNDDYEVTTFRTESNYNGRKPEHVSYSDTISEDIQRRDFTMNAMYMDIEGNIFDEYNGQGSIENKMIETVGDAKERFTEDYLRVYRYVRFTAQYDFKPNQSIDQVIRSMTINKTISFERIREEFNKILLSNQASSGIRHLHDLGLLDYIMPEIIPTIGFQQHSKFHHLTVFDHCLEALDHSPANLISRLAALCHDIGKPNTFELVDGEGHFYGHDKESVLLTNVFLKRLKYSNEVINKVIIIIANHMRLLDLENKKSIKKFIRKIDAENLDLFLDLRRADILSSTTNDDVVNVDKMRHAFDEILNEKHPLTVNDLDINGHELMALGVHGIRIGEIKEALLDLVLEDPSLNVKETLLKHAKVFISEL